MANLLEIKNLHMRFGGIVAVDGISFTVEEGKIVTLIGANGAGKSSTLRCIAGIYHPQQGEILLHAAILSDSRRTGSSSRGSHLCRRAGTFSRI